MKTIEEIIQDLEDAIVFMQGNLDDFHYSDKDAEDINDCMSGLGEAIELLKNK